MNDSAGKLNTLTLCLYYGFFKLSQLMVAKYLFDLYSTFLA